MSVELETGVTRVAEKWKLDAAARTEGSLRACPRQSPLSRGWIFRLEVLTCLQRQLCSRCLNLRVSQRPSLGYGQTAGGLTEDRSTTGDEMHGTQLVLRGLRGVNPSWER